MKTKTKISFPLVFTQILSVCGLVFSVLLGLNPENSNLLIAVCIFVPAALLSSVHVTITKQKLDKIEQE